MRYTVKTISEHIGLALQTVREYADNGMIGSDRDERNGYRYFDANSANQASASRRLRALGFTMKETREILSPASRERYLDLLSLLEARQRQAQALLSCTIETIAAQREELGRKEGRPELIESEAHYCLDYRRNDELICGKAEQAVLNAWLEQAQLTRNYSPLPLGHGDPEDHVIGLIIPERYASYVPLDPPVYRRPGGLCLRCAIRHDDRLHLPPAQTEAVFAFLAERRLAISGQAYFIGQVPFLEEGKKAFEATLYVPVRKAG